MSAPTDPAGESVALEALLLARARLYALFHKLFGAAPDAAAQRNPFPHETWLFYK